ncbi:MAG: hypothetical protein J7L54_01785, partial [Elusimicrobia bacterium]|nr:hypothetical protein [Elusimicrobiota bacterium]
IGQAIINIYKKYFIIEIVDLSKESKKWKIEEKKGRLNLVFKLKYQPIEKTLQIISSEGMAAISKDIFYRSGYCIVSLGPPDEIGTKEEMLKNFKEYKVFVEIRYLRKIS